MINKNDFINRFKRYGSIDSCVLLLAVWMLICHYLHGNYACLADFLQNIGLRNVVLIFFYYAVSRLSFHFLKKESYIITLIVLLSVSFRESYAGILQLSQGAPYPVGTLLNPNIFACLLSITCSILVVVIFRLNNRLLKALLFIIVVAFAILMFYSKSRLALLSVIVPLMCFLSLNPLFSGFIRKHLISISIILTVLFTVLYFLKKPSADGRVYMARIAARAIVHNGIFGSGPESYAGTFGREQLRYFCDSDDDVDLNTLVLLDAGDSKFACTPLTSFNEFLGIGVEYGFIAMLLAFYIMIRAFVVLIRTDSPLGYGLLSLFVVSQFSYPHCYSVYCLLLSIFTGAAGSMDDGSIEEGCKSPVWIINLAEALLFGSILYWELPQMDIRKQLDDKERDMAFFFKNQEYEIVCDYCDGIPDKELFSLNLLFEYGISLSMTGQYEKSDSILRLGASCSSNPVFWHEIGHNYVRSGNYDKAEQSYIRSFMMVPNRMTPLLYLAQLYHHIGDEEKLRRTASYTDIFRPKVRSYTTKEYHDKIMQMAYGE